MSQKQERIESIASVGEVEKRGKLAVKPGDRLPVAVLPSTSGRSVNLVDEAQKKHVVLFFYPADKGGQRYSELAGCTPEARAFRDNIEVIRGLGATVFGINLHSTERQKEFVERENLNFELLSDQSRTLVQAFSIPLWRSPSGEEFTSRNTLVVQRGGRVAFVFEDVDVEGHAQAVIDALRGLSEANR